MTILKSIQKWEDRVNRLKQKNDNNIVLTREVQEIEKEIFNIYSILFKNLVIKRIKTENIYVKTSYSTNELCLNKDGFSYINYQYGINSEYIKNFEQLKKSLEEYKKLLGYLKKPVKKKLVKSFGLAFEKIKLNDFDFNLKFPTKIEFKKVDRDSYYFNQIAYRDGQINFMDDDYYNGVHLYFNNLGTNDYLYIEQTYSKIVKVLEGYRKKMINMRKERDILLTSLRGTYSSEIILNQLKKDEK